MAMRRTEAVNILKRMLKNSTNPKEIEALQLAIKDLDARYFYRWHDIRKNSEDLPEIGSEIVYMFSYTEYGQRRKKSTNTHVYTGPDFFEDYEDIRYIAWRYLERPNWN